MHPEQTSHIRFEIYIAERQYFESIMLAFTVPWRIPIYLVCCERFTFRKIEKSVSMGGDATLKRVENDYF